ncbi:hypothetical protein [Flavobacterium sp.]|uniref:hypothetical protein n=1 Tax=Flavobacterium sp. TaxID=239 RepID=UPI0037529CB4
MKKLILVFVLVFATSIKLCAQFSSEVLRGINPTKGIEYNTNLLLQNGFTKSRLSHPIYFDYEKNSEKVRISESEIDYKIEVELNEIEYYIKELVTRFAPKNRKSKVYKLPGKNTMHTILINNNLLLIINGTPSFRDKTKGIVSYSISKV